MPSPRMDTLVLLYILSKVLVGASALKFEGGHVRYSSPLMPVSRGTVLVAPGAISPDFA